MTEHLKEIIQQAWCDGDGQAGDTFGDFLTRAAKQIEEAGYVKLDEDRPLEESKSLFPPF